MADSSSTAGLKAFDDRAFRRLAEFAPDALIAHGGGKVLWANEAAARLMGFPSAEAMVGRPVLGFVAPESVPLVKERIGRMLASGQPEPSELETFIGAGGERIPVEVSASPLGDGVVLVSVHDLRPRLRAEHERRTLLEQLRHAEKLEAIGRLAGGVAHDFNNLLAVIMSSAEVSMREVPSGSSVHESLSLIQEASIRARDLVKQILTFGQKDQPNREPLDVSEVVTSALGLARAAIPSTVRFEVAVPPQVGTVLADRTQVHQVVLNLCANARDAISATGHILVSLERVPVPGQASQAKLRVKDDGLGMDAETRSHLFEPYLTTKDRGHGLGLAVVHGIVAGLGGRIEVETAPGAGACFDVYFPLVEAVPALVAPAASGAGGHERVLLVDDEPMVRRVLRQVLESLGYRVTEAADGEEALELLRARKADFDLVLSDQTMPRRSGLELARALHTEAPGTRILLCTGFSDVLDEGIAQQLGVAAVLCKPITREELAAAVQRALTAR